MATEGDGASRMHWSTRLRVTSVACKRAMEDTLALLFSESYHYVRSQTEKMKQLKALVKFYQEPAHRKSEVCYQFSFTGADCHYQGQAA